VDQGKQNFLLHCTELGISPLVLISWVVFENMGLSQESLPRCSTLLVDLSTEQSPVLQLWQQELDHVFEGAWVSYVGEIEAINATDIYPSFQLVNDGLWAAHDFGYHA
jgi:hypothetical protein